MESDLYQGRESTIFNSRLICFFVAVALFVALLHRQNDLAVLALFVLLLMGVSKLWSVMSLSRVSVSICVDKHRMFPGETVSVATTVTNAKFLPVWVHTHWPLNSVLQPVEKDAARVHETSLLWHQQARFLHTLAARHRGIYRPGPSHLQTSDLFGFFTAAKKAGAPPEIIVYPKLVPLKPFSLPRQDLFGAPGRKSAIKDPVYIMGTRDYLPSRPSRYIHWKASARHARLQEKIFEPSQLGEILIALDVAAFEKNQRHAPFESTLEVAASLTLRLNEAGFAVGFISNGNAHGREHALVPMGHGHQQVSAILETLARLQMKAGSTFSAMMQHFPGPLQGCCTALFCGENGTGSEEALAYFLNRRLGVTMFAWHLDPASGTVEQLVQANIHSIESIRCDPSPDHGSPS